MSDHQKEPCQGSAPLFISVPPQLPCEAAPGSLCTCHSLSVADRQDQAKQMIPKGEHPKARRQTVWGLPHTPPGTGKENPILLPPPAGTSSLTAHPGGISVLFLWGKRQSVCLSLRETASIATRLTSVSTGCRPGKTTFRSCRASVHTVLREAPTNSMASWVQSTSRQSP